MICLARNAFERYGGELAPKPVPELSRTPAQLSTAEPRIGQHTVEILKEFGLTQQETENLLKDNVVSLPKSNM